MFDYLIVGAGLFGSVLANKLATNGAKVLVVERNAVVGGTVRTEWNHNICVHKHGAHIFRTNDKSVWEYVNSFVEFEPFINSPITVCKGSVYNLPFNMNTFSRLWNICTPTEAKTIIDKQTAEYGLVGEPKNLEEFALSTVGRDIYEMFIRGYTEKQWGKSCSSLPVSIMRRIPIRFTYDNNYYDAKYQGIPKLGYTELIQRLLEPVTVFCGIDGSKFIKNNRSIANVCVYTGRIDEFYDFKFGKLAYRSLMFEEEFIPNVNNYQGNAVVNYADFEIPYTRIIEHKHFLKTDCSGTIISREYPKLAVVDSDYPYYPIEDSLNCKLYEQYARLSDDIIFAGRLGRYKYFDMCDTVVSASKLADELLVKN